MGLRLTDELKFLPVEPERTEAALTTAREQRLELRRQENPRGTNIEVMNAQTSVARARDNQIEVLFRFNASQINLARAKGKIEKLF